MNGRSYRTGSHNVTLDRIMAEQAKIRARDRAELLGNIVVLLLLLAVVVVGGWLLAPGSWLS